MSTLSDDAVHPSPLSPPGASVPERESHPPSRLRPSGETAETTQRRPSPTRTSLDRAANLCCVWSPDAAAIGMRIPLDGRIVELGRGIDTSHRVHDREMSRNHVRLEPTAEGGYRICDLDTPNGTYMDGQRVEGGRAFEGRVVALGASLFVVESPPDLDGIPAASGVSEAPTRGLMGISGAARRLRQAVATVARSRGAVLLLGPTGVGKEVTAQAIHEASGRVGAFVPVNCAAIPTELAEAELFGVVRGAYTGAEADRAGFFEQADGGTIFLDEVGDLPLSLQAKLLRVLEDGVVRRVGASEGIEVDVRVVAATHVDLDASGFRRDLLGRLGDWLIRIPRLSDRKSDILALWDHFCGELAPELTPEFREALLLYEWPMNVRELRKLARRTVELAQPGEPLDVHALPRALRAPLMPRLDRPPVGASRAALDEFMIDESNTPGRQVIIDALVSARGNVKKVALENGWHRTQLYRWLKRLRIDPNRYRRG
jgi:transcriptional regulator with AAA-type ATPase domain